MIRGSIIYDPNDRQLVQLQLDAVGAKELYQSLNRALNTWDPTERSKDILDLCDKLGILVEEGRLS